jgi:putative nucleotidyltransferase with HDIG domain
MAEQTRSVAACRKVELAVGELDALSVPPCVAVQYLPKLLQGRFSPSSVVDIVACEPALAARVLSLAQRNAAGPVRQRHALRLVLDRFGADEIRDVLLETRVSAAFEIEFAPSQPAVPERKDLILHSLAVACCAKRLAETSALDVDPQLAYSAGLLHDIGKLALQDIMPKSLAAITQESQATQSSLYAVEQKHLGTNHAMLGKQLAQKWRLPEPVAMAIWLHHSDAVTLLDDLAEIAVVRLIWAADNIARQAGIGHSGSFDPPGPLDAVARVVGADTDTLEEVLASLTAEVASKAGVLGLDIPNAMARYCDTVQATVASLARRQTELSAENRTLKIASSYLDFAKAFLLDVGPSAEAIDIAEDLARRWQRFFQTGSVCLYLTDSAVDGVLDAVVVEALGHSGKVVVELPAETAAVPKPLAERFTVLDAQRHIDWLLEQVDIDFDPARAKLVPLSAEGKAVAIMAFELNFPGDVALFAEKFETAASMAGAVLALTLARKRQTQFSERLIRALGKAETPAETRTGMTANEALAEMAAGVAHELNNPLSVISGRAQLLAQTETDEQRKRDLAQIHDNVAEASGIIDDLMSFAEPSSPRPARTSVRQIIEEAVDLAGRKSETEHVNTQIRVDDEVGDVTVDSAQVVSALANVIANAIESYADNMGPVKITAEPSGHKVRLEISDLGCGMDAETLRKATHPFFSAKPAGRKRGMGLAYATRLIQLNQGALQIESHPAQGTTVTITLP